MLFRSGNLAASGGSFTRFYLSLDGTFDPGDRLLTGSHGVPALSAGGTDSAGTTLRVPTSTPVGVYSVFACADDTKLIVENSETNNCRIAGTRVSIT